MATYNVIVHRDLAVPMRDGVMLFADLYLPDSPDQFPVLVQRTPYDKSSLDIVGIDYWRAAREGYAVLVQDVRGRFSSQGSFYPFLHEPNDGYDTVEWAANQSWCTGSVGMVGGSYLGATQWLAALNNPPHLKALFPVITPSDYQEGWVFQGGAFQLAFCFSWTLLALILKDSKSGLDKKTSKFLTQIGTDLNTFFNKSAFSTKSLLRPMISHVAPHLFDWLDHADDRLYWDPWCIENLHSTLNIPAYHVTGWYDTFLDGTLRNYMGLSEAGNAPQRLLIGPWAHTSPFDTRVGEIDFGPNAKVDLDEIQLHWFDYWLKGKQNGALNGPPVRFFVMGEGRWQNSPKWPLSGANETKYYLHTEGEAANLKENGSLRTDSPNLEPPDTFQYDPNNPVPTNGGGLCCDPAQLPPGPFDQATLETRQDILKYTTHPISESIEVTGPIQVHLWIASSASDTDFTAKLVDVYPDGKSYNLADGIIRARYRDSRIRPQLLDPHKVYPITIHLGATSNLFKAGHRIRLEVSSSNFPRFDLNPNTGTGYKDMEGTKTAIQTIFHDSLHPSCLVLPIVKKENTPS